LTGWARFGRAPSTASRKVRRNCLYRSRYRAISAQLRAEHRAARPKVARLAGNPRLRAHVQGKLVERWSPEKVSVRLEREFADDPEIG
jgi:transposase, IS30 family